MDYVWSLFSLQTIKKPIFNNSAMGVEPRKKCRFFSSEFPVNYDCLYFFH